VSDAKRNHRIQYLDVTKQFHRPGKANGGSDTIVAVSDVSLTVDDGEVVSLIGPSGCGKSTLLNMGSGLYLPTSGKVYVDGDLVNAPNPHVAFMLQKDLLLPWRNIRQNVEIGLEIRRVGAAERRERAMALLQQCRLSQFADSYPHQLSGGMRQRAALARTLAVDPSVLLLDEPFSALDAQTKMILQQDLARTLSEQAKTAIFITHDLVESISLSDRILVMSERPGKIIKEIKVDLPDRHDPMARRQDRKVGDYVAELMGLLHVSEQAVEEVI
jgi:NitT/TauT family transport system ATP-binding protein